MRRFGVRELERIVSLLQSNGEQAMSQDSHQEPQPQGPVSHTASQSPAATDSSSSEGDIHSQPPAASAEMLRDRASGDTWCAAGLAILAAAGIIGGISIVMSSNRQPDPPETATPVAAAPAKTIRVGAVDLDTKATELLQAILAGTATNADAEALNAIDALGLAALAKNAPRWPPTSDRAAACCIACTCSISWKQTATRSM